MVELRERFFAIIAHALITSALSRDEKVLWRGADADGHRLEGELGVTPTRQSSQLGIRPAAMPIYGPMRSRRFRRARHIAFLVENRSIGRPSPRAQYSANEHGALVTDFDGYNIEAVCRRSTR